MMKILNGLLLVVVIVCFYLLISKPKPHSIPTSPLEHTKNLLQHSERPLQAETAINALDNFETPIADFFIRSHFGPPRAMSEEEQKRWTLVIDGLVENPVTITVAELRAMAKKSYYAVLECSGNARALQEPPVPGIQWQRGAVGNALWEGVSLSDLLARAKIKPDARFLRLEGADKPAFASVPGFVRSIPIEKGLKEDSMLALTMNREVLPLLHGGPLRIILPGWYGENWIKWITRISVTDKEDDGFYMKKGYRVPKQPVKPGEPWDSATGLPVERLLVQSFFTHPIDDADVQAGSIQLRGKAFSGERFITQVEISLDQGKTWQKAELEPARKEGGWQAFSLRLELLPNQSVTLMSRATDSTGESQPLEHEWNPGGYVRNAVDRITIKTRYSPGAMVMNMKCTACHSLELVESQRLNPTQWEGVLKKMVAFGVSLSPEEHRDLLAELTRMNNTQTLSPPIRVSYHDKNSGIEMFAQSSSRADDEKHGAHIFQQKCAMCHGQHGDGNIGPRLINRGLTKTEFESAVLNGRGTMPGFKDILQRDELKSLEAFIHRAQD